MLGMSVKIECDKEVEEERKEKGMMPRFTRPGIRRSCSQKDCFHVWRLFLQPRQTTLDGAIVDDQARQGPVLATGGRTSGGRTVDGVSAKVLLDCRLGVSVEGHHGLNKGLCFWKGRLGADVDETRVERLPPLLTAVIRGI